MMKQRGHDILGHALISAFAAMLVTLAIPLAAHATTPKVTAAQPAKIGSWATSRTVSAKGKTTHFFKYKLKKGNGSIKLTAFQDQWSSFAGRADFYSALGWNLKEAYRKHEVSFKYSDSIGYTYDLYLYNSDKRCIYHETGTEDVGDIDFGYKLPAGTYYVGVKISDSGPISKSELEELKLYKLRFRFQIQTVAADQLRIKSLTSSKGKIKATWSKVGWKHMFDNGKSATYNQQIRISRDKSMAGVRTLNTTRKTWLDTSGTIRNLAPGATYHLQIRASVKVGGRTYWTQWSKAEHVKVKR